MSQLSTELKNLHAQILAEQEATRYTFQPQLAAIIDAMHAEGSHVPPFIRDLNEDLISDKIEAQFDNIPV